MLYDNSTKEKSVASWIEEQTGTGKLDCTSGYFTVGILSFISRKLNDKISDFRFVLGDIVCNDQDREKPINLLTETITVDAALRLNQVAQEAVAFLKQEKVKVHTVEPNFCHAKTTLFRAPSKPLCYFVSGSSNLTEAGLGMQHTSNIELNVIGQGTAADYEEICRWFDDLWQRDQTHAYKTVDGKRVPFKKYLIEQIESIFRKYTPHELYYKTLFELFRDQLVDLEADAGLQQRIGHLKHTKIYKSLYEFQQKGVLSLIKKIEDYDGAVLADAVGLGKTWSALAVIKYYEYKGYRSILLCPKKLSNNWRRYLKDNGSIFDADKLDYTIRYHTDLQDNRIETNHTDGRRLDTYFQSDTPKLIVIDESHNLRNRKSGRYQYLVEELLKKNKDVKVLLLSATPINNDFRDLRNQFSLIVKDQDDGFADAKGILVDSIENKFRTASKEFKRWSEDPDRNIRSLLQKLPDEVIRLIDRLVVARTRRHIKGLTDTLTFPEMQPPQNEYLDSLNIDSFKRFEDILAALPNFFAAYKPAVYSEKQDKSDNVLENEALRDQFLVVMLNKLLVKRLESSWSAFHSTLKVVQIVHQTALTAAEKYATHKEDAKLSGDLAQITKDEEALDIPLGKREIRLSEIAAAGNFDTFRAHLEDDVRQLERLIKTLDHYEAQIAKEQEQSSADAKLDRLMGLLNEQLHSDKPSEQRRLLLFTSYTDTANYLFDQLRHRGYGKMACISGDGARCSETPHTVVKNFEPVLERFCPFTKLYMERDWPDFEAKSSNWSSYHQWSDWVRSRNERVAELLDQPIEIVIATDCLSEGQNLQDCDTVINYDIHWNPVRVIQRLGRIDRIGSPNDTVRGINFWPSASVNDYLGLQKRVEDRAIAIATTGSEVPGITDRVQERLEDETFQEQQEARMLEHLESSWEELEDQSRSLNFSDLSLEIFRQDLLKELSQDQKLYEAMPLGIYTGFKTAQDGSADGIVALLGYPSRKNGSKTPYHRHNLVYIDQRGQAIFDKPGEVLKFLSDHRSEARFVPQAIDQNDSQAIDACSQSIKTWLRSFSEGDALDDLISGIQGGDLATQSQVADRNSLEAQYDPENCDLILWFTVSK
ncbi:MAG: helicase [Puniceicoccaceae bacterium]|nr:MAG: helicase [Puniceicoccaceae bacterium]